MLAFRGNSHYNGERNGAFIMICSVKTLSISGIQGNLVTAECYISSGLPGFDIVGLPDAAVKEAQIGRASCRERV